METKNGNIIQCVCRRYRIQNKEGLITDVESYKPLGPQITAKLLEEDSEIDEFFTTHKILGTRYMVRSPQSKTTLIEPKILAENGPLTPHQRLNQILKMKGEFTRKDYVKFLTDNFQCKINKWTSHSDMRNALTLNKIQIVEVKKGRENIYRVSETEEIEESLYKKLLQDRKVHISTLT